MPSLPWSCTWRAGSATSTVFAGLRSCSMPSWPSSDSPSWAGRRRAECDILACFSSAHPCRRMLSWSCPSRRTIFEDSGSVHSAVPVLSDLVELVRKTSPPPPPQKKNMVLAYHQTNTNTFFFFPEYRWYCWLSRLSRTGSTGICSWFVGLHHCVFADHCHYLGLANSFLDPE